ncbi:hypothetical protein NUW58_g7209 [Xylaria curta]|uniref:Uncharacterized protein n=1 Tax=Xylaria curta TaxID=42375 RepID=A0ACC1NKG3_9PEZI|nr:hypothetical protein NUW58_g7209 [Xylaria curta]
MLNTPVTATQKRKHRSTSIQRNNDLASFLSKGAAGVRKGSSDAKKRRKNRRVERAKQLIRDYGNGKRPANRDATSCTLYLGEYRQLLEEIGDDDTLNDIFDSGLRYDYTADSRCKSNRRLKQFVVRTPTAFHQRLSDEIDEAIKCWEVAVAGGRVQCGAGMCSGQYCTHDHTKEIARNLKGHRSESVISSKLGKSDKKDPDLSYAIEGYDTDDNEPDDNEFDNDYSDSDVLEWPGLVVEIGWSQKSSDLRKKCEWYIKNSNGRVRTVIGVDLHDLYLCYPKRKTQPHGPGKRENNKAIKEDIAKMADATKKNKALGKIFLWRAEIDSGTNQATAVLHEGRPQVSVAFISFD